RTRGPHESLQETGDPRRFRVVCGRGPGTVIGTGGVSPPEDAASKRMPRRRREPPSPPVPSLPDRRRRTTTTTYYYPPAAASLSPRRARGVPRARPDGRAPGGAGEGPASPSAPFGVPLPRPDRSRGVFRPQRGRCHR
ncbi:unnamed protein product, partial [Ectocarpus sp. 8 AP-2014]